MLKMQFFNFSKFSLYDVTQLFLQSRSRNGNRYFRASIDISKNEKGITNEEN